MSSLFTAVVFSPFAVLPERSVPVVFEQVAKLPVFSDGSCPLFTSSSFSGRWNLDFIEDLR